MTDVQNTPNAPTDNVQAISSLKKKADLLGVPYKSNTSVASLQKAISDKLEAPIGGEDSGEVPVSAASGSVTKKPDVQALTDAAMKLVRVIITPMEANKASSLENELFCAGNSVIGTVKRVITFSEPWHVEQILLNTIKEKQYQQYITKKNARGITTTQARLVKAYSIEYLDPLTEEEIAELGDRQLRTRSLEDE